MGPDVVTGVRSRPTQPLRRSAAALLIGLLVAAFGCGVESRQERIARAEALQEAESAAQEWVENSRFRWPADGRTREVAALRIAGRGEIRIALYPELAPKNVENFEKLAREGFYDGTTFHRVIPGFMIQGGDPNTRNEDPSDDGYGGPGYKVADEFSEALHLRGTVSMANMGSPDSGGSQFFIVQKGSPNLDGNYTVIGKVISGMDVVDQVIRVERDYTGRWGPTDRPLEDIVIEQVEIDTVTDDELLAVANRE